MIWDLQPHFIANLQSDPPTAEQQENYSNFRIIGKQIQKTPEKVGKYKPKSSCVGTKTFIVSDKNDKANGKLLRVVSKDHTEPERNCEVNI